MRTRSITIPPKRLTRGEREDGVLLETPDDVQRPRTRGDCADGERPCPFVACRHHLYLDVNEDTGSIKINFPGLEPDELAETCSLDVADRGGATLEEVGALLNLTREGTRQIETKALGKLVSEVDEDLAERSARIRPPPAVEAPEDPVPDLESDDSAPVGVGLLSRVASMEDLVAGSRAAILRVHPVRTIDPAEEAARQAALGRPVGGPRSPTAARRHARLTRAPAPPAAPPVLAPVEAAASPPPEEDPIMASSPAAIAGKQQRHNDAVEILRAHGHPMRSTDLARCLTERHGHALPGANPSASINDLFTRTPGRRW